MKNILYALLICGFAAALSACGGGGGGGGNPPEPPINPNPPPMTNPDPPDNSATMTVTTSPPEPPTPTPTTTPPPNTTPTPPPEPNPTITTTPPVVSPPPEPPTPTTTPPPDETPTPPPDMPPETPPENGGGVTATVDPPELLVTLNPLDGVNYRTDEFNRNYGLGRINADFAYQRGYFGQSVTVGVMDSGINPHHRDLSENIVAGRDFVFANGAGSNIIDDPLGHGTRVAGVVGATKDDAGVHGVAPSVSIMPLQISDHEGNLRGEYQITAANFAITNGAKIINASFGNFPYIHGVIDGTSHWITPPGVLGFSSGFRRQTVEPWADVVRNEDVVVVWAAGNDGFNTENGMVEAEVAICNQPDNAACFSGVFTTLAFADITKFVISDPFGGGGSVPTVDTSSANSLIPFWAVNNIVNLMHEFNSGAITESQFMDSLSADPDFDSTAERWLAVVATNGNDRIAQFSNGCGIAQDWCIAAPGVRVFTTDGTVGTGGLARVSGTSYSAPHVSGALALLQSAAPELPMTAIRQILLTTAKDLCAAGAECSDGVDEVYGWGLVDVDEGIRHIGSLTTADGKVLLSELRRGLPGEFLHLRGRLDSVSVAVRITDDSYYNLPLSDIVGGGDSDFHRNGILGGAAKEMQANKYEAGESFRFSGGLDYADGESRFIGEGDSPFAAANAEDVGGHIRWTTADYGGMSGFGEYGRTQIKAEYGADSLISAVRNAKAESWTAGIQHSDIWQHGDKFRFSARQESRISGGEAVIHYPVADGDSHLAFIGEGVQTIRTETAYIPLKQGAETIWTAGYSQESDGGKWSAAAEWNAATNAKGFSFAAEWKF